MCVFKISDVQIYIKMLLSLEFVKLSLIKYVFLNIHKVENYKFQK